MRIAESQPREIVPKRGGTDGQNKNTPRTQPGNLLVKIHPPPARQSRRAPVLALASKTCRWLPVAAGGRGETLRQRNGLGARVQARENDALFCFYSSPCTIVHPVGSSNGKTPKKNVTIRGCVPSATQGGVRHAQHDDTYTLRVLPPAFHTYKVDVRAFFTLNWYFHPSRSRPSIVRY